MTSAVTSDALGPLAHATIRCPDVDHSATFYARLLGYRECAPAEGQVVSGGHVLRAPGERWGAVHLVPAPTAEPEKPLRRTGWSTLEFIVADLDAVARRVAKLSDVDVLTPPSTAGAAGHLRVMHVSGPSGEIIYLTQITRRHDRYQLPPDPPNLVGRLFIAVWSTPSLERDREWLETTLVVTRVSDRRALLRAVNRIHRGGDARTYRISSLYTGSGSLIEIDEIDALGPPYRPRSGITAVTFASTAGDGQRLTTITSTREVHHDATRRGADPTGERPTRILPGCTPLLGKPSVP